MVLAVGDSSSDNVIGIKPDSAHAVVGALSNNRKIDSVEGSLNVGSNLSVSGTITHSRAAQNPARGICYSALHGRSDKSIIMVPLPGNGADLDGACHARINGGWHAGGVAKGNYYYQNCPGSLENSSYGGGYTSFATEEYFERNSGNYGNCGPSNAFICCSPQFPN
jgi:hypothetical protein